MRAVGEPPREMSWTSFAAMLAALGLVAGVATTPVRAEDASSETNAQSYVTGGRSKAKRDKAKSQQVKKSTAGSSGSSGSVFVGSSAPEEGKKKIILSPADERDPDEISLSSTNRPLLFFP